MSQQGSPPGSDCIDSANTRTPYAFNKKVMQVAIIVLFLVFFFVLMLHLYARWVFQRSSRSYTIRRRFTFVSPRAAASDINTGLDTVAMAQLPTFVYKANISNLEALKLDESVMLPSLECAVCISEFQEGEKGRMLPSCKHAFHTECIDMWLFSHSTCPLCRKNIVRTMAASPNMTSTHEQQHHEEEHDLPGTTANVNRMQMEPSSSSSPLSLSMHMSGARALSQITIDIPQIEGNLIVYASGPISAKCITEQEACSSQPLQSPGFRRETSIKRMLSTQSRRHKSSSQEGCEESQK